MSVVANIISAVIKSVVGDKIGNDLANELIGISIDGVSEKGIDKISDFIKGEKAKIEHILSKENMESLNISEGNIDYVIAEIKDLLSETEITDEVLRQCKYDSMNLSAFLWNKYCEYKNDHIECESDIKKGLFAVSEALIKLVRESEDFEKDVLIQISNAVDDTNIELQKISEYMKENYGKLDADNQTILGILRMILEQNQEKSTKSKYKKQKINSRTQEYADIWNKNMFLNDFDKRDENAGVNIKMSEVYLEEHLPHYIWRDNQKISTDVKDLLKEYTYPLNDSKMLLILGQPGIGKSTLITWMTANFNDRFDDIFVYRFASDLGNIDWKDGRVSYRILEELSLNYDELAGKTLILDGFDEINIEADNRRDILDSLYGNWIYSNTIKNFSLIITCRENYIQEFEKAKCTYITLQPWDEIQIKSFCKIFQEKTKNDISESTIDKLLENKDILGIPLILYMVLALNISIDKEGSIVDVYDKIFSLDGGIYDRCIDFKNFSEKHRIGEIKEQIHQISRDIAIWMFENKIEEAYIPKEGYQEICDSVMQKQKQKNEILEQDFLIGNFFKLVKHCEGIDSEELYFVHRSIFEYFVAESIYNSMSKAVNESEESLACVFGELLKQRVLSKEILQYLKYKIRKSSLHDKFYKVNDAFKFMLKNGMTYYTKEHYKNIIDCELRVFKNMLEIIHAWDEICNLKFDSSVWDYLRYNEYSGLNLSGMEFISGKDKLKGKINLSKSANLPRVYLRKANLIGTNLRGANLTRADLKLAKLLNAVFSETDFSGADLQEADLCFANLERAILRRVQLQFARLESANLSGANLMEANLIEADLRNADLTDTSLLDAELEASRWYMADVKKALHQLKTASFRYIIVEDHEKKRWSREDIFIDENELDFD